MEPEHVFYTVFEATHVGDEGCTEANASRFGSCTSSRYWVRTGTGATPRGYLRKTDHRSTLTCLPRGCDGLHGAGRCRAPAGLGHDPRRAGTNRRRLATSVVRNGARRRMHWPVRPPLRVRVLAGRNGARVRACQPPGRGGLCHGDATRTSRPARRWKSMRRAQRPGRINGAPAWSRDGRHSCSPASRNAATSDAAPGTATVVDADGSNLRRSTTPRCLVGMVPVAGRLMVGSRRRSPGSTSTNRQARGLNEDSDVYAAHRWSGCSTAYELRPTPGPWRPGAGGRPAQAGPATGGSSSPCTNGPATKAINEPAA